MARAGMNRLGSRGGGDVCGIRSPQQQKLAFKSLYEGNEAG